MPDDLNKRKLTNGNQEVTGCKNTNFDKILTVVILTHNTPFYCVRLKLHCNSIEINPKTQLKLFSSSVILH